MVEHLVALRYVDEKDLDPRVIPRLLENVSLVHDDQVQVVMHVLLEQCPRLSILGRLTRERAYLRASRGDEEVVRMNERRVEPALTQAGRERNRRTPEVGPHVGDHALAGEILAG